MLILRFFLYVTFFGCLTWGSIFFVGPVLIRHLIVMYSDGVITPGKVILSPKFDVTIRELEIDTSNVKEAVPINGEIRALEISWSIFSNQPFITFQANRLFLDKKVFAQGVTIATNSLADLNPNKFYFATTVDKIEWNTVGSIDEFFIDGYIASDFSIFTDLSFRSLEINSEIKDLFSVKNLDGNLNKLRPGKPVDEQNAKLSFELNGVSSGFYDLQAESIGATFNSNSGQYLFSTKLSEIGAIEDDFSIEEVQLDGKINFQHKLRELNAKLSGPILYRDNLKLRQVFAKIIDDGKGTVQAKVSGLIESPNVEVHETYVGWLPESKFNLALLFDTSLSELNLTSDIKVATEQKMNIDVSASLNGRLDNYKEILGCNVIFCRAAFIDIDYVLNLDE